MVVERQHWYGGERRGKHCIRVAAGSEGWIKERWRKVMIRFGLMVTERTQVEKDIEESFSSDGGGDRQQCGRRPAVQIHLNICTS